MGKGASGGVPRLLHLDEHLLVVEKPAGVCSEAAGRGEQSVLDLLRGQLAFEPDDVLRSVHRLDKEVSGVLVFARTAAARRHLVRQFAGNRAHIVYHALVSGYVQQDGEIDLPLRFSRRTNRLEVAAGRSAATRTYYRILERVAGNTWLECRLQGGRGQQLRAQLAAIGHPLSVDPLYGGGQAILLSHYKSGYRPSRRREERPLIDRLTLHAANIALQHPATGLAMEFESPLPKDLRATLTQLGRAM